MNATAAALEPLSDAREEAPSLEEVYRDQAAWLWRYLRRLGVPERDIEDVAHDSFVVVHRKLASYDPSRPIRPWLAGIAGRVASERRRRQQRRREDPLTESGPGLAAGDSAAGPDGGERSQIDRQRQRWLRVALDEITSTQREVFVMHDIEGWSMPEIAEALGAPLNTLYSRLRLAREQLRRRLAPLASAEGNDR